MLCRTWKFSNYRFEQEVPESFKGGIEQMAQQMRAQYQLTFYKDGTYESQVGDSKTRGTWSIDWRSSSITQQVDTTKTTYRIIELSETKYSFESDLSDSKVIIEMQAK